MHLRSRQQHDEKCTEERCVSACGFVKFAEWLDAPVTKYDMRADARRKERLAALMRGQVPV